MNTKNTFGKIRTWWFWNSTFTEGIIMAIIGITMLVMLGLFSFHILPTPETDLIKGIVGSFPIGGFLLTYVGFALICIGKMDRDSRRLFCSYRIKAKE